jgi:hypothetical protein
MCFKGGYTMKIQQDDTGFYIENDQVICRPTDPSRFETDETVDLKLDKNTALLIIDDYKETWTVVYKPKPVIPLPETFTFEHPYYYIEHPGWYILATTLLGIYAFNLGFLISSFW